MYDIIGDIHGHAVELVELLEKLGYEDRNGCFRHADRKVIFCGDFVDRGPNIPDVVSIARTMVEGESALAVMGNHEFNALAFHTPDPRKRGEFLRRHTKKNLGQHAATCNQFSEGDLQSALDWFATLPTSLDLGNLRIVHACWDESGQRVIDDALNDGRMDAAFLARAMTSGDPLYDAVEALLKGLRIRLPNGLSMTDFQGIVRTRVRIRWFEKPNGKSWAQYSLPENPELPNDPVPSDVAAAPYPADAPPVFFGHYWLADQHPQPLAANIACLDYSVAKGGMLCAYRFDGESTLNADRFVSVAAR